MTNTCTKKETKYYRYVVDNSCFSTPIRLQNFGSETVYSEENNNKVYLEIIDKFYDIVCARRS